MNDLTLKRFLLFNTSRSRYFTLLTFFIATILCFFNLSRAAGETVSETIGTLPVGKKVQIIFTAEISSTTTAASISNQGTISGDNFVNVLTDDPDVGGNVDPTVTPIDGPDITVSIVGNDLVIENITNTDDTVTIVVDGTNILISDPNRVLQAGTGATQVDPNTVTVPIASITNSIIVNTQGGDDTLTVDFNGGDFGLPITYNGGTQTSSDGLAVVGDGINTASYTPSATTTGDGTITVDTTTINFTGLEPVDISGMALVTLSSLNADSIFDVSNGTDFTTGVNDAIHVSGTTGGVLIETVAFFNNATVIIDTATVAGNDAITITSADNTHNNTNLIIDTGSGSDSVAINGNATVAGTIDISSGGSITDGGGKLTAAAIALRASTGIGTSADRIDTETANFEASTGTVGVFISNIGKFSIGNVSTSLNGIEVTTSGDIDIINTVDITVSETIVNQGTGDINLATGASSTLALNVAAGTGIVSNGGGLIELVTDMIDLQMGSVASTGNLIIRPFDSALSIGVGTGATGTLNIDNSEIALLQDGFASIQIGDGAGSGAVDVNSSTFTDPLIIESGSIAVTELDAGTNAVTLNASGGAISDGGDAGTDIIASDLSMTAGGDIGATGDAVSFNVDILVTDTSTSNGDQFLMEVDSVAVTTNNGLNAGAGTISLDGGIFQLNSTPSSPSPISINGGTLAGTGSTNSTVTGTASGGVIAPGVSPGILTVNDDVTFDSSTSFDVEINGTTPGTGHDQLSVTGTGRTVTLDNATLNASIGGGYTPTIGDTIVIIDNVDATSTISGTFNGLAEGDTVDIGGNSFLISYMGGTDGNDVVLMLDTCSLYSFPYTVGDVDTDHAKDLRQAITCANANATADTIELPQDITYSDFDNDTDGQNALPSITSEITIKSDTTGIPRTIERDASLRASVTNACGGTSAQQFRIFHIASGGNLTLEDLVIQNGCASTVVGGGGFLNNEGTTTVTNSTIRDNSSGTNGGGFHNNILATITVTNSTISGNLTSFGGGFYNVGTATVTNSTISGNSADFSSAPSTPTGGGFYNEGITTVTNSTISGNSGNTDGGGGFYSSQILTINNSIVAASTSRGNCLHIGTLNGNNNFTDDTTCPTAAGFTQNATLGLGSLQNNGGPTETIALGTGSAAINGGDNLLATGISFDQRGSGFPRIQNTTVDAGAYEAVTYKISGTVFEDVNYGGGAGRDLATSSGVGRPNVTVELYSAGGTFIVSTITNGSGQYEFDVTPDDYFVRVVNSEVTSSRTGGGAGEVGVQTFRTDGTTDETGEIGGRDPSVVDAAVNTGGIASLNTTTFIFSGAPLDTEQAQSVQPVTVGTANVTGVDFGFNFDTIVNINDSDQGSLRQFILNANLLTDNGSLLQDGLTAGAETSIFEIPGAGPHTIQPNSSLPTITDPVILDGTTQSGATCGDPHTLLIELEGSAAGGGASGLEITAGSSTVRGLVINTFSDDGIELHTNDGNTVVCNHIGTDVTGLIVVGNADDGVEIDDGSSSNMIGGSTAADRNVISGNFDDGVDIEDTVATSSNNIIMGNYIGVGSDGLTALGNLQNGVQIFEPSNTVDSNVISSNGEDGVAIFGDTSSGNVVTGNYIGTDATGLEASDAGGNFLGNFFDGVYIEEAPDNIVGGSTDAERNVIASNFRGVAILGPTATGNMILGNYIGVASDGLTILDSNVNSFGNFLGVYIEDAPSNIVGGSASGEGNVISNNAEAGVVITGTFSIDNRVLGNYIGTDFTGSVPLGNGDTPGLNGEGVIIAFGASENFIGVDDDATCNADEGNVIAGNLGNGVLIADTNTDSNRVAGNYIGTNSSSATNLANELNGVLIIDEHVSSCGCTDPIPTPAGGPVGNIVGTNGDVLCDSIEGNVIAGNDASGVVILGMGTESNRVVSNYIGTDSSNTTGLENQYGVWVDESAAKNRIETNVISQNTFDGVALGDQSIPSTAGSGNTILTNSIFNNGHLGIDLANTDGVSGVVTPNDANDTDSPGEDNDLLNFPVITGVTFSGGNATVSFDLDVPIGSYRIEFFNNTSTGAIDPTGHGEGETFVHAENITHTGSGLESFTTSAFSLATNAILAATTTECSTSFCTSFGSTSEFSQTTDYIELSIDDVTMLEGNSGDTTQLVFTVTLNQTVAGGIDINYATADNTAEDENGDSDYESKAGLLSFTGTTGEQKTITIEITEDDKVELDETFFVNLSAVSGSVVALADNQGEGTITNDDSATLSIDDISQTEGDSGITTYTFTVTLDSEVDTGLTVDYTTADDTATTADSDYSTTNGTLTFAGTAGETEQIIVDVIGDTTVEADENFLVNLSNIGASGRDVTFADSQGQGTITNDDGTTLSIDDVSQVEGDSGNTTYTFTVTLNEATTGSFTVNYATADDTATTADGDYTAVNGTLDFAGIAGEAQQFSVEVNGDTKVELDETFLVNLSNVSDTNVTLADSQGEGTITNDDSATLSIDDVSQAEGDSGTTSYTFTVTLDSEVDTGLTVDYATADDTATTADSDYTAAGGGSLVFAGMVGETKQATVEVNGDTAVEINETFLVDFSNIQASGRDVTLADSQGEGTIENDDGTTLSIDDVSQAEGDGGSTVYTFTITLNEATTSSFTVDYATADDTATAADGDYTPASGTLPFIGTAGETQVFVVVVSGDNKVELDETFLVNLSNVSDANVLLADSQGEGTITNDDSATLSIDDVSQTEGDSGSTNFTFTVTLDNEVDVSLAFDFTAADGSATVANNDYNANSGQKILIGSAGETTTIDIEVIGDTTVEPNENFFVNLNGLDNGSRDVTFANSQGEGTITNDDGTTLNIDDPVWVEGDSGTTQMIFTVTLNDSVPSNFTVDYATADGTATTADSDYVSSSGQLDFMGNAGETQTISVDVIGDTKVELDETFLVNLSNISIADATFSDSEGEGTITNDDSATLSIDDVSQAEGDGGSTVYTFTITLNEATTSSFTVDYATADDTATAADGDYTPASGALPFIGTAGETQVFVVVVSGDNKVELDETFLVNLSNVSSADVTLADSQGEGTITNDDSATLSIDDVSQAEGDSGTTTFTFTVTLDSEVDTTVEVDYATTDDTATTADSDYTAVSSATPLSFAGTAGETQTIDVEVNGDTTVEINENFLVDLSNIQAGGRDVSFADSQGQGTIENDDGASLSIGDVVVTEGNSGTTQAIFTVTLSEEVVGGFSVDYATADDTATTADSDYTAINNTLAFAGMAGETKQITVEINGDAKVELDEIFLVNLSNVTSTDVTLADAQGEGTITNDDSATLSIDDVSQAEGDSGTTTFTFTVTLDSEVDTGITVDYATTDDTATTADSDYTTASSPPTLPFTGTAGETRTIDVEVNGDTIVEVNENFLLDLSNIQAGGRDVTFADSQGQGTIENDDGASLSIDDVVVTEGNSGTTQAIFTVTLSEEVVGGFSVDYATADGTATTADSDYTAIGSPPSLTFAGTAGETQTITVEVNGDTKVELDETFLVNLSNVSSADVTLADSQGEGTITNDDSATLSIDDVSQAEGDSGTTTFTFTVTLDSEVDTTVEVDYATTDDTATTADSDYTAVSSATPLSFAGTAGETQTIDVEVNGDTTVEINENFLVDLSNIQAGGRDVSFADSQGQGTIENDDGASLSIGDVVVTEGNSGTTQAIFTVTLSEEVVGGFSVDYATADDTATTADSDYTAIGSPPSLTFAGTAGETQTITVEVNGDTKVELDETFLVNLSNVSSADVTLADSQGEGTITNDDSATLSIDDVSQAEGDSGTTTFTFTVTLDSEVDTTVEVDYATTDDTATTADSDYTAVSSATPLSFAGTAGETQTIDVEVNGDTTVEINENFLVDLSNIQAGGRDVSFADSQGQGTIENDDGASLSIGDVVVTEGNSGTTQAIFTVTLSEEVVGGFSVDYATADGTATTADSDYTAIGSPPSLTFAGTAGETQTITVEVNGDTKVELDETFLVNLSNVSSADVTLADSQGEGTITNDDSATLSIDDVSQAEGDSGTTTFTFTVTLDSEVDTTVEVDYATTDDTATTADSDYTAVSSATPLSFAGTAGETQTIDVEVNGDTTVEINENFLVDLSNIQAGGRDVSFADSQGQGTIENDDGASLSIGDVVVTEGNSGTTQAIFTVTLSEEVVGGFSVDYATADDTATTADSDYTAINNTLAFAGMAGETKQITVEINGDAKVELDEIFLVNLSNVTSTDVTLADAQGEGTITNDDSATLSIDDVSQAEGDSGTTTFTFTVTLDSEVDTGITVDYATTDDTATTADSDYTTASSPPTLPFTGTAGETRTIDVEVNGDTIVEVNENFLLDLSNIQAGGRDVTFADSQGQGTIENDDGASLSIDDVVVTEGNSGTTQAIFTVTLSEEVVGGFSVDYATADGTAQAADGDYVPTNGTLDFKGIAGETQQIIVEVTGDTKVELDETFFVNLSNVSDSSVIVVTNVLSVSNTSNVIIADAQGEGTIINNDSATLSIDNISQVEGNSGTSPFIFTVTLDNEVDAVLTVDYTTTNGTAETADSDYVAASNTLAFAGTAGETQQITIDVIADARVEPDETFFVSLSNVSLGAVTITDGEGEGIIINDDSAALSIIDVSATEGDTGSKQFVFKVALSGEAAQNFTVDYSTVDNTAKTSDNDYTPTSGTLSFNGIAGETKSVAVEVLGDSKVEPNEDFFIQLSNISIAEVDFGGGRVAGSILNDDSATLSIDDVSLLEGDSGQTTQAIFMVSLTGEVAGGFSVDFSTADGTGQDQSGDGDYQSSSGTLDFAGTANETKTITVDIVGDDKVEFDETFFVNLSNLNPDINIVDGQGIGTILNDDDIATPANLNIDDVTVIEGDSGETNQAVFTVSLTGEVVGGFTVDFSTQNDTAEDESGDNDYQSASSTLNFAGTDGETQTITIDIVGDDKVELDETFFVNLSSSNPSVNIVDGQGQGTIINDDGATLTIDDVSLNEGNEGTTLFTFTVSLDNEVEIGFTVDFATADDTATVTNNDYNSSTNTLNFAGTAGETQTITIEVIGDTNVEPDEQFFVNLINLVTSGHDVSISDGQGIGTILNDDVATLNIDDVTVIEGDSGQTTQAVFTVTLTGGVVGGFSVDFASQDAAAEDENGDGDYQSISGTLNFVGTAGESQTIVVTIVGDDKVEPDEDFFINLTNISVTNVQIEDGQGLGTITNDDTATLSIDDVSVSEGGAGVSSTQTGTSLVFTVSLSGEVVDGFSVGFATQDATAEDENGDGDYHSNSGTLNFTGTDGETQTISVGVVDDNKAEPDETFFVNLDNISVDNVSFEDNQGLGTILNDDEDTPLILMLQKEVLEDSVSVGDKVPYRIIVTNPNDEVLIVKVTDTPPAHTSYVKNSASPSEPTLSDNSLVWDNLTIEAGSSLTISYELRIAAGAEGELINVATARGESSTGRTTADVTVTVTADVKQSLFSRERSLLTGRVYIDQDNNSSYNANVDTAVVGARLILSNGWQVETDTFGNYSFRDLDSGIWTIQLDANTVTSIPKEHPESIGDGYIHRVLVQGLAVSDFVLESSQSHNLVSVSVENIFAIGPLTIAKQLIPLGEGIQVVLNVSTTEPLHNLIITDPVPIENEQARAFEFELFEGSTTLSYELPIAVPLTQPSAEWSQQ